MYTKSSRYVRSLVAISTVSVLGSIALHAADRDDKIESTFKDSYNYRTQLNDTSVSISSKDGVVTLKGKVDNDEQRRLAEDTARGLPGVTDVRDEIKVRNEPKEQSDDWISLKVKSALLFHRNVSATGTKVNVVDGVVLLTGTAKSDSEKALAGEYAADIKGVKSVNNQIQVNPEPAATPREPSMTKERVDSVSSTTDRTSRSAGEKIDDASVTAAIKSSLAVRRSTSAVRTEVTTQEGVVTLRGEAKDAAEKDLVTKIAEDTNGVREVHNEMTVRGY
jgi:hyperosmotically inducible protein